MSEIKLTEDELKRIQDLNQDFTKAKLEIADNVLRQQMNLKALEDLRVTFGVEEKKLAAKIETQINNTTTQPANYQNTSIHSGPATRKLAR